MHSKPTGGPFEVKQTTEFASNGDDLSLRRSRRKADWRISPLTFLCYLMNLIDKVAYNYAGAMGMKEDLHLKGNEFTNVATAFFVAYLVAELPMSEHLEHEDSKAAELKLIIALRPYPDKIPSEQSPRCERCPLGNCHRIDCGCQRLPESPGLSHLPRNI
jgi:hypothetical protein